MCLEENLKYLLTAKVSSRASTALSQSSACIYNVIFKEFGGWNIRVRERSRCFAILALNLDSHNSNILNLSL
jgi:hypothetical protein